MQYLPIKYISVCSMMIRDIYKNLKYFCVTFAKIHPGNPPLLLIVLRQVYLLKKVPFYLAGGIIKSK